MTFCAQSIPTRRYVPRLKVTYIFVSMVTSCLYQLTDRTSTQVERVKVIPIAASLLDASF